VKESTLRGSSKDGISKDVSTIGRKKKKKLSNLLQALDSNPALESILHREMLKIVRKRRY